VPRSRRFFLAVQGIGGEQDATHAEGPDQRLGRRDLVAFGDLLMGQDERRLAGERAEHLGGGPVVQVVEAAPQRLAVERHDTRRKLCKVPHKLDKAGAKLLRVEQPEHSAEGVVARNAMSQP
jgi:hypothetical protein